jgi:uncharacterized protein
MQLTLYKKPKNPIIIVGFPGFGLVGNIVTEFLIEHLNTEQIGCIRVEESTPLIAVHEGKVVEPIGISYDKKNNIILLHVITSSAGIEWQLSQQILKLAEELGAKEILSFEGVVSQDMGKETESFYFTNNKLCEDRFKKAKIGRLNEGIVVGVTGALLLEKKQPISAIFVETHSNMPDSKAAAKAVEALDKYFDLNIDYKPLLKQAEKFEDKLKHILEQKEQTVSEQEKKKLSYIS